MSCFLQIDLISNHNAQLAPMAMRRDTWWSWRNRLPTLSTRTKATSAATTRRACTLRRTLSRDQSRRRRHDLRQDSRHRASQCSNVASASTNRARVSTAPCCTVALPRETASISPAHSNRARHIKIHWKKHNFLFFFLCNNSNNNKKFKTYSCKVRLLDAIQFIVVRRPRCAPNFFVPAVRKRSRVNVAQQSHVCTSEQFIALFAVNVFR